MCIALVASEGDPGGDAEDDSQEDPDEEDTGTGPQDWSESNLPGDLEGDSPGPGLQTGFK